MTHRLPVLPQSQSVGHAGRRWPIGEAEMGQRDAVLRAYDGIGKVPAELKDLTFEEGIDLGIIALHGSKKLIVALK